MVSYYLPSESKIGVGFQVHLLANTLVKRGHDVTVFSACGPTEGAMYRTVTLSLAGSNRTFRFALKMRRVDLSSFDVLHAHGDDYWLWQRRVPAHVRTLHGSCFSEALRIQGLRERARMVLLGFSEVLASGIADQTVTVSGGTWRWLPWVEKVIPNGVDLGRLSPGIRSQQPSVLFVGTYRQRKRGQLLADVFQREVLPRLPDAQLWMVCDDAPSGLPGVRVTGRISDDELSRLYGEAWVFCLPSTYEGFGIPYVEAMASGCPVVATPNPGVLEITRGGRLGVVVGEERLGRALIDLLQSERERQRLAKDGLDAASLYDIDNVARSYEALYQKLLAERAA